MKQVFKYDVNGKYLEPVIIHPVSFLYYTSDDKEFDIDIDAIEYQKQLNPELKIKVLPIYEIPEDCTEKELPQPNYKPKFDKELDDWVESASPDEIAILTGNSLEKLKENRYLLLDSACENAILGRFSSTIDGLTYEFSYDSQAQSRFSGVSSSFTRRYITEIEWTCYLNGERTSKVLSEEQFDIVAKDALRHEMSNIAKFRDKIAELNNATTEEQVNSVEW